MTTSLVKKTTALEFQQSVMQADKPVLVDFWAEWCGPCHALAPVLNDLAEDYEGRVEIQKLNIDENPEMAEHFGIRSIPTLMLFDKGEPVQVLTGVQPRAALSAVLDTVVH
ncbi:UNVERIFIED_CONTAM: hypothetical protein GTU68_054988 [Idotea baltica]|nr:hypothetical protein [Idotea baltica]